MKDLIGRLLTDDLYCIDGAAELMQKFITEEGLEKRFYEKTGKGRPREISYEELEKKAGLQPFAEFHVQQIRKNLSSTDPHQMESQGMRQTGRTTRMLLQAIRHCMSGSSAAVVCPGRIEPTRDRCMELLKKLEIKYDSNVHEIILGKQGDRIRSSIRFYIGSYTPNGWSQRIFYDESFND